MDEKKYKKILLETFKAFDLFCKQHNIKYFASGGSALGAVRHKGIIPWDDDIDVVMLKDDYDKFISLKSHCADGYEIKDWRDEGFYLPFAKFIDSNTTLWEVEEYEYVIGVFIDIFPLYPISDNHQENANKKKQYNDIFCHIQQEIKTYHIKQLIKLLLTPSLRGSIRWIKAWLKPHKQYHLYRQKFQEIDNALSTSKASGYLMNFYTFYPLEKETLNTSWFQKQVEMPFEDTTILLPNGYHEYLSQLFGDYMTPPPPKKQLSHHYHYFIDLDHRLTIDEIKEIKNHGK